VALYLVIQVGAFLSRFIPRSWRYLIGTAVGDLVYAAWPAKRRILQSNMAHVLGLSQGDPRVRSFALKSLRNYCKYLIEFLELPVLSSKDRAVASMKVQGMHHLDAALARGKGVIVATAHFGTIEIGALRLVDMTTFHAVYDAFTPAYLDRLIQRKRREKGINLIAVKDVRQMLQVLRRGDTLALLFDRPLAGKKGVPVRFFGRETAVPAGPAVLALKTGAALLPMYQFRQPDRSFETVIFPPVAWAPSGNRERDVQAIMQRLMDTLQTVVRQRPDQWYMFRPMWPKSVERQAAGAPHPAEGGPAAR
jgi:KDO2-lipid IV(A) lauroyltransferase